TCCSGCTHRLFLSHFESCTLPKNRLGGNPIYISMESTFRCPEFVSWMLALEVGATPQTDWQTLAAAISRCIDQSMTANPIENWYFGTFTAQFRRRAPRIPVPAAAQCGSPPDATAGLPPTRRLLGSMARRIDALAPPAGQKDWPCRKGNPGLRQLAMPGAPAPRSGLPGSGWRQPDAVFAGLGKWDQMKRDRAG